MALVVIALMSFVANAETHEFYYHPGTAGGNIELDSSHMTIMKEETRSQKVEGSTVIEIGLVSIMEYHPGSVKYSDPIALSVVAIDQHRIFADVVAKLKASSDKMYKITNETGVVTGLVFESKVNDPTSPFNGKVVFMSPQLTSVDTIFVLDDNYEAMYREWFGLNNATEVTEVPDLSNLEL